MHFTLPPLHSRTLLQFAIIPTRLQHTKKRVEMLSLHGWQA